MSSSNEQHTTKAEDEVLSEEALEAVAGGAIPGGIGGGIGPITTTIAYPMPVPLPIEGPTPIGTTA